MSVSTQEMVSENVANAKTCVYKYMCSKVNIYTHNVNVHTHQLANIVGVNTFILYFVFQHQFFQSSQCVSETRIKLNKSCWSHLPQCANVFLLTSKVQINRKAAS